MTKGMLYDGFVIYKREMLIFKANLRSSILRSMIFPLVILIFFGNIGNGIFNTPVAVVNLANNQQSAQFINALQQQNALSIKAVTTEDAGLQMLKKSTISALVIILPGFPNPGGSGVYVYYSKSDITSAGGAISFIGSTAAEFDAHVAQGTNIQEMLLPPAPNTSVQFASTSSTTASYRDFLIAGVVAMVAAFGTIFGGGTTLITDRQIGNLKTFLITPISSTAIVIGKTLYGTTQAVIYAVITLIIAAALGGHIAAGWIGIPWILLLVIALAFGLSSVAIILASKIQKFEVYTMIANAVVMPLWFLSGAFFPISSMPKWMASIAMVDPLTYAVNGMRSVMLAGNYPLNSIIFQFSILIGFGLVMFVLAIKLFKNTI